MGVRDIKWAFLYVYVCVCVEISQTRTQKEIADLVTFSSLPCLYFLPRLCVPLLISQSLFLSFSRAFVCGERARICSFFSSWLPTTYIHLLFALNNTYIDTFRFFFISFSLSLFIYDVCMYIHLTNWSVCVCVFFCF